MKALVWTLAATTALGGAMSGTAHAEVTEVVPEVVEGLAVDLLSGIQFAKLGGGFGRDELYLDLLKPVSEETTPVIVFVLGSGWAPIERDRVLPQLVPLAEAGFAVATVDYRGIGEARFPEPEADVKAAIRFLRANAELYNIDPDAIGILGNSAGGHLALMAGLSDDETFVDDRWADVSSAVQAVAAIYPASYPGEVAADNPYGPASLHFGFNIADPANAETLAEGSPATHISEDDSPVYLIHGTADPLVPLENSQRFHDELTAAGVEANLLMVEGLGHSIEDTMKTAQVRQGLIDFFDAHLRGE